MANSFGSPEESPGVGEPGNGDIPEQETIRQAQEGDAAAFERIYLRYNRRVYGLCLRMTKNQADAEDLTQEAFLQVFRKIHTSRGESAVFSWFHRLSVNIVLMSLRKRKMMENTLENEGDHQEQRGARLPARGDKDPSLFFFQAEDGIRDKLVTGVQTCALPILGVRMMVIYGLPLGLLAAGSLIDEIGFAATGTLYAVGGLALMLAVVLHWRADLWHEIGRASCRERV